MRVLIIGSLNYDGAENVREDFISACRQLGAALAREKVEFVIGAGMSHPNTADKYIIEGASDVSGTYKVWIFQPEGGSTPTLPVGDNVRAHFIPYYKRLRGPWVAGRVPQIQAVDVVLMIGGSRGSAQVGYSAVALEKPVLAIGSFGGSASELWPQFEPFYQRLGSLRDQVGNLREAWHPQNAELAVKTLNQLIRRRAFRRNDSGPSLILFGLNVALFALWVWLFVHPPRPWQAAFFALLAVSAFLGTALRSSLHVVLDPTEHKSREAVIAELSAGLVLAFALALLYLAGSFTFTGKFEVITDNSPLDSYQRVAVAMGIIGVVGGWLLERVAASLTRWFGDRMPGADGT